MWIHYRKDKYEDREVDLCEVLVPANLILYASSVLDKEIFNPEAEESYRAIAPKKLVARLDRD